MNHTLNNYIRLSHPYFKIMELSKESLQTELSYLKREELINWLCWNDRNGNYKDEDSLREFDNILYEARAIQIVPKQITEN